MVGGPADERGVIEGVEHGRGQGVAADGASRPGLPVVAEHDLPGTVLVGQHGGAERRPVQPRLAQQPFLVLVALVGVAEQRRHVSGRVPDAPPALTTTMRVSPRSFKA
jgi:hypothetical protein